MSAYKTAAGALPGIDRWMFNVERDMDSLPPMSESEEKHLSVVLAMHRTAQKRYAAQCKAEGHLMVDTSFGGPETGEVSGYCTRCGVEFRNVLY